MACWHGMLESWGVKKNKKTKTKIESVSQSLLRVVFFCSDSRFCGRSHKKSSDNSYQPRRHDVISLALSLETTASPIREALSNKDSISATQDPSSNTPTIALPNHSREVLSLPHREQKTKRWYAKTRLLLIAPRELQSSFRGKLFGILLQHPKGYLTEPLFPRYQYSQPYATLRCSTLPYAILRYLTLSSAILRYPTPSYATSTPSPTPPYTEESLPIAYLMCISSKRVYRTTVTTTTPLSPLSPPPLSV